MTEKSVLRETRERKGLSRQQVAEALGTTVHHYYHCEMPPFTSDPELIRRAQEYLGISEEDGVVKVPDGSVLRTWKCPACHERVQQFGIEAWHRCHGKPGKLIKLVECEEEEET